MLKASGPGLSELEAKVCAMLRGTHGTKSAQQAPLSTIKLWQQRPEKYFSCHANNTSLTPGMHHSGEQRVLCTAGDGITAQGDTVVVIVMMVAASVVVVTVLAFFWKCSGIGLII